MDNLIIDEIVIETTIEIIVLLEMVETVKYLEPFLKVLLNFFNSYLSNAPPSRMG